VFQIYGFESGDVPGANPGGAAKFLLTIFPFVLIIISCIFSRFLNFPSKAKEINTIVGE
jgi:GPH family glycoside/pentoside/hexuronide:cation symporter